MNQIPYCDNNFGTLTVNVELQNAADVFLVDEQNLQLYQGGYSFEYFGGHFTQTPVKISVNKPGRWFLIVDDGGAGNQYFYNWS